MCTYYYFITTPLYWPTLFKTIETADCRMPYLYFCSSEIIQKHCFLPTIGQKSTFRMKFCHWSMPNTLPRLSAISCLNSQSSIVRSVKESVKRLKSHGYNTITYYLKIRETKIKAFSLPLTPPRQVL